MENKNIVCEPEVLYKKSAKRVESFEYKQLATTKDSRMTVDEYISKVRAALDKKYEYLQS